MWLVGVTLVTWYGLRDDAANGRPDALTIQSGLYFRGTTIAQDRPKPALDAFRFPFVAYKAARKVRVWGRTPRGEPGAVVVESFSGAAWKPVRRLRTDRFGIFRRTISAPTRAEKLRARLADGSRRSRPFSLTRPPDLKVNPFGGPYDEVP
jgi:hypothetical protein